MKEEIDQQGTIKYVRLWQEIISQPSSYKNEVYEVFVKFLLSFKESWDDGKEEIRS